MSESNSTTTQPSSSVLRIPDINTDSVSPPPSAFFPLLANHSERQATAAPFSQHENNNHHTISEHQQLKNEEQHTMNTPTTIEPHASKPTTSPQSSNSSSISTSASIVTKAAEQRFLMAAFEAASNNSDSGSEDDNTDESLDATEKKRKVQSRCSKACVHCQKARCKCSNQRPCARCVRNNLNCCDKPQKKRGRKYKNQGDMDMDIDLDSSLDSEDGITSGNAPDATNDANNTSNNADATGFRPFIPSGNNGLHISERGSGSAFHSIKNEAGSENRATSSEEPAAQQPQTVPEKDLIDESAELLLSFAAMVPSQVPVPSSAHSPTPAVPQRPNRKRANSNSNNNADAAINTTKSKPRQKKESKKQKTQHRQNESEQALDAHYTAHQLGDDKSALLSSTYTATAPVAGVITTTNTADNSSTVYPITTTADFINADPNDQSKKKKRQKKEATHYNQNTYTLEQLQPFFFYSINEAADKLEMGISKLKFVCRELNISRWPYRKIRSINRHIELLEAKNQTAADKNEGLIAKKIRNLQLMREEIILYPQYSARFTKNSIRNAEYTKLDQAALLSGNLHFDSGSDSDDDAEARPAPRRKQNNHHHHHNNNNIAAAATNNNGATATAPSNNSASSGTPASSGSTSTSSVVTTSPAPPLLPGVLASPTATLIPASSGFRSVVSSNNGVASSPSSQSRHMTNPASAAPSTMTTPPPLEACNNSHTNKASMRVPAEVMLSNQ